MNDA
jgi:hypothetical protein